MFDACKKYFSYGILAINILIIIFFWWMGSGELFTSDISDILLALGRVTGLLAVYCILLQFVFMGRAVWLEQTFGLDKLARIHRINGYLSIVFILMHPLFLTIAYAWSENKNLFAQFVDFVLKYDDAGKAFLAAIIFLLIVFLSIYIVRKHLKYETWYYIHLLTYLAVLLAFGHQLKLGGDFLGNKIFVAYWYLLYGFVFGNVLLFRFFEPILSFFRYRFFVSEIAQETEDAWSIFIGGRGLESFKTKPGQFLIVRFLSKNFRWQAHPFSLSGLPKEGRLQLTIKNCGDFTSKISTITKGTPVLVEGPYGIFTPSRKNTTKYLFIAGGIGITPIHAIIEKVAPEKNLILLYSNKTQKNIIFKKELDELSKKHEFPLYHVTSDDPTATGEKGRIDKEKLKKLCPDFQEREIYICGPKAMIDSINSILHDLGIKSDRIHFEKFSL